jgi:HEAT repeat protein
LLPNPDLKDLYDKVVWVYVYRDFTSKGQDHAAERVMWRFGVSSWPQLFLADPESLAILKHTGRSVDSFRSAVLATKVKRTRSRDALEKTAAAEERADALEARPSPKRAAKALDDDDIVVRYIALGFLAEKDPKAVAKRATELLAVPNDPFRYEVCNALAKAADPKAARALEAIVAEPKDSLNPNVLRIRAVQALATCGNAKSVEAIRPHATSGAYFNGLTGVSIDALVAIAKRDKKARKPVKAALKQAYPEPPKDGDDRETRACVALAKRVHKALADLGEKRAFPGDYNEQTRRKLMD